MNAAAWFALGLFVGAFVMLVVVGLCTAAGDSDRREMEAEQFRRSLEYSPEAVNHAASFVAEEYPMIRAELAASRLHHVRNLT